MECSSVARKIPKNSSGKLFLIFAIAANISASPNIFLFCFSLVKNLCDGVSWQVGGKKCKKKLLLQRMLESKEFSRVKKVIFGKWFFGKAAKMISFFFLVGKFCTIFFHFLLNIIFNCLYFISFPFRVQRIRQLKIIQTFPKMHFLRWQALFIIAVLYQFSVVEICIGAPNGLTKYKNSHLYFYLDSLTNWVDIMFEVSEQSNKQVCLRDNIL